MNAPHSPQVAVIGGGLAGLTAAATLARHGIDVTVFEGGETIGGRARSRTRDGFAMNLGPHALYRSTGGRDVLRRLGVPIRGRRPRLDRAGARWRGEHSAAWSFVRRKVTDRRRVASAVAGLGGRARQAWVGRNAQEWLDDVTDDPVGRAVLASLVRTTTYAADLSVLDAAATQAQLRAGTAHGVLYLHGGWSSLVTGLADVVRAHGGTIETGVRVETVEHDDQGVHAIRLADGTSRAAVAAVVAINDPARAAHLMNGGAAARLSAAAGAVIPVRMAHLDVALRPLPSARFPNLFGIDEEIYLTVPSSVARDAPNGAAVLNVGRYLRPGEEHLDHRPALEAVLDIHQPGWRDHVVDVRYVPRSLVSGDHCRAASHGALGRPGVDVCGVGGLVIAGDWVGPTGMLADAAVTSGERSAISVVETLRAARPARMAV
ncbi:MAG: FAD-dependent oxidoreductase [Desertimonas sp.]